MRRFLVAAALALVIGASGAQAQARDVTGTVRRSDSGTPVPRVLVKVLGTQNRVCTDEHGRFTLRMLRGELQVSTEATGFETGWFTIGAQAETADLRIEPGATKAPPALDGPLLYVDGILVETARPSPIIPPLESIVYVDGIQVARDGRPGC